MKAKQEPNITVFLEKGIIEKIDQARMKRGLEEGRIVSRSEIIRSIIRDMQDADLSFLKTGAGEKKKKSVYVNKEELLFIKKVAKKYRAAMSHIVTKMLNKGLADMQS